MWWVHIIACKNNLLSSLAAFHVEIDVKTSVKIRTICYVRNLWKFARSCKQLCLLCPTDPWNLPGTALLSGFQSSGELWNPLSKTTYFVNHYDDVIMSAMASQITILTIVYSTVYPGADQSKHQSSASLAFVWGIHRGPVNSPHKWPVTRKMFPFDDVIMNVVLFGTKDL